MRDILPSKPRPGFAHKKPSKSEEGELYEITKEIHQLKRSSETAFKGDTIPVSATSHIIPDLKPTNKVKPQRPMFAQTPPKRPAKVNVGSGEKKIIISFFGIAIVVAAIAAVIFIPTATISIELTTAPLLVNENITIGSTSSIIKSVPGTSFFKEVSVTGNHQVTNTETVGTKSTGTIQIINQTIEQQKIKENSRLITNDDKLFYMKKHAIVPPNSQVQVPIEAALPGEAGNIEPQKLNLAGLDESAQAVLYAELTNPTSGGSGQMISVVSQEDLDQAKKEARTKAQQQAESQIRKELPDQWTILEESWARKLASFESSANVGDKTPQIDYTASATVQVIGYEKSKLEEILKNNLESDLDEEYMLFPGPISYNMTVNNVDWEKASVDVSLRVTHTTIPKISLDSMRQKLAGRSAVEATNYLENMKAVKSATIDLWPFWVNSIPRIEKRIDIDLLSDS